MDKEINIFIESLIKDIKYDKLKGGTIMGTAIFNNGYIMQITVHNDVNPSESLVRKHIIDKITQSFNLIINEVSVENYTNLINKIKTIQNQ